MLRLTLSVPIFFFLFFFFHSPGSLLLLSGFLYLWQVGVTLSFRCMGFSWWWLLVAEHAGCTGFSSYSKRALECSLSGAWAWLPCSMWKLPRLGIEPMPPVLADRFLTTDDQGTPYSVFYFGKFQIYKKVKE